MKPSLTRRHRRRSTAARTEGAFFKKESQESFFGGAEHEKFFHPAVTVAPAPNIQRQPEKKEEEKVQRAEDKKEEKKLMKKEDKKEEDKIQRQPEKKEEEKVQRAEDKKEEKKVMKKEDKKEEEKIMKMEDKKEEEKIHKKEVAASSTPGKAVSNYIGSLNGKGNPLPAHSNHFFSSKMGYDFSNVKVHTDKEAAESAKGVNAKAYTIGKNVVFNEGQYNTESSEGKKLMAHELAHVVQQEEKVNKKTIQRVAAGFDIRGVYPDAASFPTTIFFDFNSSTIPSSETTKIPGIATPPAQNISLIGTSSEEGETGSGNVTLINNRINKVDGALNSAGHTGVRTKTPQLTAGHGNMDYRRVRAVDVITTPGVVPPGGSMPSITPSCSATPANPTPQVEPCGISFIGAWPNAFVWTLQAVVQMSSGNAAALGHASTLFPGVPPATITGHLSSLLGQVGNLPAHHQCHNTCDGGCSRPAYNTGSGASQMMTLCPGYIHSTSPNEQSETLIHESLHATPGLTTADTAYSNTRLISSLTGAQALNNTDSFVLLILRINGIAPPSGVAPTDSFSGFSGVTAAAEQKFAADALAFLEQWLLNAEFDTSILYTAIDTNIGNAAGWNSTENFEAEIAHAIAVLAGITDPGSSAPFTVAPVANDKVKVAGMFDRYTQLRQKVYMNAMTINKITAGTERWDIATNAVFLKSAFFSLTPENAVKYLLRLIIVALGTVPSSVRNTYIESANEIRKHRSTGP